MSETIDVGHEIPVMSPVCSFCKHLRTDDPDLAPPPCKAFPRGIPMAIWTGAHDHREPFEGNRDIQYVDAYVDRTIE